MAAQSVYIYIYMYMLIFFVFLELNSMFDCKLPMRGTILDERLWIKPHFFVAALLSNASYVVAYTVIFQEIREGF